MELGCGTGEFTRRVARAGARLIALDLVEELLVPARLKVGPGAAFVRGDAQALPFPDGKFDVVYGCSVLHHLDLEPALCEVRRILRPGGRMVFSEPNLLNPQVFAMFKWRLLRPRFGVSADEMAFTRGTITRVLGKTGFAKIAVRYFDFLHPAMPPALIRSMERIGTYLERIPLVRTMSGSLLIYAER